MIAGDADVIVVIDWSEASRSSNVAYCGGGGFSSLSDADTLGYWLGNRITSSYDGGNSGPVGCAVLQRWNLRKNKLNSI